MFWLKKIITPYIVMMILFIVTIDTSIAAFYGRIDFKETLNTFFDQDDLNDWMVSSTGGGLVKSITSNVTGSKIAFLIDNKNAGAEFNRHVFVANGDGSGLSDITSQLNTCMQNNMPKGLLFSNVTAGNLEGVKLSDDGSRLFYWILDIYDSRPESVYYSPIKKDFIWYYDLAGGACGGAAHNTDSEGYNELLGIDMYHPPVTILTPKNDGSELFFHHIANNNTNICENYGMYMAETGGYAQLLVSRTEMPVCSVYTSWNFVDASTDGMKLFFFDDESSWVNPNDETKITVYMKYVGGNLVKLNDTPLEGFRYKSLSRAASADGSKLLFPAKEKDADYYSYYVMDTETKSKMLLKNGNTYISFEAISPAGNAVLLAGTDKESGLFYLGESDPARADSIVKKRNPLSNFPSPDRMSGLSSDNQSLFYGNYSGDVVSYYSDVKIRKVDMSPADFSQAPNIVSIGFSKRGLVHDASTEIYVYAKVSDAQGLESIQGVSLYSYVAEPCTIYDYVGSPIYNATLYDKGTNGDITEGDGIYTGKIKTHHSSSTDFFDNICTLPSYIRIRIVARDRDENYCAAETPLQIVETEADLKGGMVTPIFQLLVD